MGILGRSTFSPMNFPFKIVASITLLNNQFPETETRPLHRRGGLTLRRSMIGAPTLRDNLCGGTPGKSSEFKNSVGKLAVSSSFVTVASIDI